MGTIQIGWKTFLSALAVVVATEVAAGYAGSPPGSLHPLALVGLVRILEAGLIILVVCLMERGLSILGLDVPGFKLGSIRGLVWSAGFGGIAAVGGLILFLGGIHPARFGESLPGDPEGLLLFFLVGGVIGPLAEEAFFRGICYGFFRRWGVASALILTTLLFVSAHAFKSGIPFTQIVGGVVFALAYEKERSLMAPIIIHILGNLALFSLAFF